MADDVPEYRVCFIEIFRIDEPQRNFARPPPWSTINFSIDFEYVSPTGPFFSLYGLQLDQVINLC